MKTLMKRILTNAVWLALAGAAYPQTPGTDHVTVPLSDPARPGTVKVSIIAGSISVKAYAGKDIIVDAKARDESEERGRGHRTRPEAAGMKRIPNMSTGLTIEEENNRVSIGASPTDRPIDITIQVPSRTDLNLKTINDGDITVDQVRGEIEVNDINGAVTLTQVAGSVVAHALNGNVKVGLTSVEANKPMSFSSLNGDLDVSFPPDFKANVSMKSDNGEIYSDFDVKIDNSAVQATPEDARSKGGKYRIKIDRTVKGMINGGGPEMQFKTFNGNIYIRRSAK